MYVVTSEEMRGVDRAASETFGIPGTLLMENAGRAVVAAVRDLLGEVRDRKIYVFAGKGNNGGDGFVAARHLSNMGARVRVCLMAQPDDVTGDAGVNLAILQRLGIEYTVVKKDTLKRVKLGTAMCDLVIDALLGTGISGPLRGLYPDMIQLINDVKKPVVAVDIPSGVDADSGAVAKEAVTATRTVTFGLPKMGLLLHPGAGHVGELVIDSISLPPSLLRQERSKLMTTADWVQARLPARPRTGHKGTFGHTLVVGGSIGFTGAAVLSSVSALRAGAGLVTCAVPRSLNAIMETKLTEVMTRPVPDDGEGNFSPTAVDAILELARERDVVALGPGLGRAKGAQDVVFALLDAVGIPVVVDADALNALATRPNLLHRKSGSFEQAPWILTPHPGEMARLLQTSTQRVQDDRVQAASDLAARADSVVVLKGNPTMVAAPGGKQWFVNVTGNPGLATGGTGDVLTGIIASLVAQGMAPLGAAAAGVYLHGLAGDLAAGRLGEASVIAGDVVDAIGAAFQSVLDKGEPV